MANIFVQVGDVAVALIELVVFFEFRILLDRLEKSVLFFRASRVVNVLLNRR